LVPALEDLEDADIPHDTQTFTDYITEQWVEGDRLVWNRRTPYNEQHRGMAW